MSNGEHAANTIAASKPTRPSIVPEKLNFSAYEQFEGEYFLRLQLSLIISTVAMCCFSVFITIEDVLSFKSIFYIPCNMPLSLSLNMYVV